MKKELKFQKYDGTEIKDVNKYVKEWVKKNPWGKVMIGCDSQSHSNHVKYAISIVMHRVNENGVGKGAHVIYSLVKDYSASLKKDIYSKLWREAEYTVVAAKMIKDCHKDIVIHLDFNKDNNSYSNIVYAAGKGYVEGFGFKAYGKPDAFCASHNADQLCKSGPKII